MPGFTSHPSAYVKRYGAATLLTTITLIAGAAFSLRGGTNVVETRTEIVNCTATGGLAKYSYCNWQEPTDNAGSGSTIDSVKLIVGKSPVALPIDGTVGASATVSGALAVRNFTDVRTNSGQTIVFSTGSIMISEGNYFRVVTLTNPTSTHTSTLIITYTSRLSR